MRPGRLRQKVLKSFDFSLLFVYRFSIISSVVDAPSPSGKATDSDSVIPRFESLWGSEAGDRKVAGFCFYRAKAEPNESAFP